MLLSFGFNFVCMFASQGSLLLTNIRNITSSSARRHCDLNAFRLAPSFCCFDERNATIN